MISSTTPTWLLRLEMVTRLSNGSSTIRLRQSNLLAKLATPGIFRMLGVLVTCKSGKLTAVGSRLSVIRRATSSTRKESTSMLVTPTEKERTQLLPTEVARNNKSGRSSMSAQ